MEFNFWLYRVVPIKLQHNQNELIFSTTFYVKKSIKEIQGLLKRGVGEDRSLQSFIKLTNLTKVQYLKSELLRFNLHHYLESICIKVTQIVQIKLQ